jgi:hypothetical protein
VAEEKKRNLRKDMAEFRNLKAPEKEMIVKTISLDCSEEDSDSEHLLKEKDKNGEKSGKVRNSGSAEIIAVVKPRDDLSSTESVTEDLSKVANNANPARVKIINDIRKWRKTMQLYAKQKSLQD